MSQDAVHIVAEAPALRPLGEFAGSLSQRVYASLKEAILDLSLRPGVILRKGDVCEAQQILERNPDDPKPAAERVEQKRGAS